MVKDTINVMAEEVDAELRRQLAEFNRRHGKTVAAGSDLYAKARALAEIHGTEEAAKMVVTSALKPGVAAALNAAASGQLGDALSILQEMTDAAKKTTP